MGEGAGTGSCIHAPPCSVQVAGVVMSDQIILRKYCLGLRPIRSYVVPRAECWPRPQAKANIQPEGQHNAYWPKNPKQYFHYYNDAALIG